MPPPPAPPGQAREQDADHQGKLDALRARLHDEAGALRTPGDWGDCLRLAARLPGEDWGNILLIHAQRPGATQLRGYRQWTATGQQVRKGENGIAVFTIPPPPRRAQHAGEDDEEPAAGDLARRRPGQLPVGPVPDHRAAAQRRRPAPGA